MNNLNIPNNITQILATSDAIHKINDLNTLCLFYEQIKNYNHPQIYYDFGTAFLNFDQDDLAKDALMKGATFGLKFPSVFYSNAFIDSVGQCLGILLIKFSTNNNKVNIKLTSLAYVYLSRCIELHYREAQDSYRTRGLLFNAHMNQMIIRHIIQDNLGADAFIEPFVISDFFFAATATDSPLTQFLTSAQSIHSSLQDLTVGGKDANRYSLKELAELGEARHSRLFKAIEEKSKKGLFDTSLDEFHFE